LPVVAVPAHLNVTLDPCVIVWLDVELLYITTFCPTVNAVAVAKVTPPVVMSTYLPLSVEATV
jgi:hypothetical protein